VERRQAIQLLREIGSYPEAIPFICVYLKPHKGRGSDHSEGFELHIKTNRDTSTRRVIEQVAHEHQVGVREESGGFLVIYTPERKLLEIAA